MLLKDGPSCLSGAALDNLRKKHVDSSVLWFPSHGKFLSDFRLTLLLRTLFMCHDEIRRIARRAFFNRWDAKISTQGRKLSSLVANLTFTL